MIKISTVNVYESYRHRCSACGRILAKDRYEEMDVVKMDHTELKLCVTCSRTLYRALARNDKRRSELRL